ncbi:unnamed protein product [Penicillium bialowiezense]
MFENARAAMNAILSSHPWSQELASILPLSALIDFLDVPRTLHTFQLTGNQPLWCWPITPSASRLLLSNKVQDSCNLDRFGASLNPICLDGRHGDLYHMMSPETLRLCLESLDSTQIANDHPNMKLKEARIQNLEVVRVSRAKQTSRFGFRVFFVHSIGWIFFFGLLIMSVILNCFMMIGFLGALLLSGVVIHFIHGGGPRKLLVEAGSEYNRVVVSAMHTNETNWKIFYGESSIVNSLVNRPLSPKRNTNTTHWSLRYILRFLIISQWGFAIGAATLKGWDAYFIVFWISFCAYLFPSEITVRRWMEKDAKLELSRYQVQLSSRRALLNTIMALNPDTFAVDQTTKKDTNLLFEGALKWIDPILKEGPDRTRWENITRLAMIEARQPSVDTSSHSSGTIDEKHQEVIAARALIKSHEKEYWHKYIAEGIEMAANIRRVGHLTGRTAQGQSSSD